jgi:hypothetical protein
MGLAAWGAASVLRLATANAAGVGSAPRRTWGTCAGGTQPFLSRRCGARDAESLGERSYDCGRIGKNIARITREEFVAAITAIEDQGKRGAADDLRKFTRTFCDWAVNSG